MFITTGSRLPLNGWDQLFAILHVHDFVARRASLRRVASRSLRMARSNSQA
jgi:hypothetical protein